jgi:hypothetical protein
MYTATLGALFLITQLLQTALDAAPLQAGLHTHPCAGLAVMPVFSPRSAGPCATESAPVHS